MFVQGYIATLTVNGSSLEPFSSAASLQKSTSPLNATTIGVVDEVNVPGLKSGAIEISMHLDTVGMGQVVAAEQATVPVAFVFRPGALGTKDAGQWNGDLIITELAIEASTDDNWQMNISAVTSGPVPYTPAA